MTPGVRAIRTTVGLARRPWLQVTRVRGRHAWDVVDRVVTSELQLRDGQLGQSLLLAEDGTVAADVLIVADDEDMLLLTEGLPAAEVRRRLEDHRRPAEEAAVEDPGVAVVGFDGPFAWELLARLGEAAAVGLPYLTLYRPEPDLMCLRAGTTGEYGYLLLVPSSGEGALVDRLWALAEDMAPAAVQRPDLAYCALENWFFDIAALPRPLDPVALQLQWRVSRRKAVVGSAALEKRRAAPGRRRLTAVSGPSLAVGQPVHLPGPEEGEVGELGEVGEVVLASPTQGGRGRPATIGAALLDLALAHSGIAALTAGGAPIRTLSPPFVLNRSLYVRWQQHTWAGRHDIELPEALQDPPGEG